MNTNTVETYRVSGGYSLATGQRLPDAVHTRERLGIAPVVTRRQSTFPCRNARFFDLTQWGGGFIRLSGAPGAVCLPDGLLCDLRTGVVTRDSRFLSS